MKKNILLAVFCLVLSAMSFAQVPQMMSYQAVVRGNDNNLVVNQQISMRVSILQGSADGGAVYTETHSATTNANGLVSIEIGNGTSNDEFSTINWANGPYFVKTETDVNGGENYEIVGVSQLLSVPYAMYAQTAGNVPDVSGFLTEETDPTVSEWAKAENKPIYNYSEIEGTPEIPTVPTNVSAFENDANYVVTEADPTVPAWAKAENKPIYNYSEIEGTPEIPTVPTNVSAFENDANYLTSYTETQNIADVASLGNSLNTQLKDVTDPTDNQDAATKKYVDGLISHMLLTIDSLSQRLDSVTIAHEAILEDIDIRLGFVDERDGNHYGAIKIGSQIWMTENLHYEGDIPLGSEMSYTTAYRYYPNNNSSNVATYGYLYNWPAAMNGASSSSANPSGVQGICPNGWHLPSDAEWTQLSDALGGTANAGAMLVGNANAWTSDPLTSSEYFGTTGFAALPAGDYNSGNYNAFGSRAFFWTATESDSDHTYYRDIGYDATRLARYYNGKNLGFSVRCVRD